MVGIKPTLGLVSRSGIVPISAAQDTAGPMTATVADAAALLTVLAGADAADPATDGAREHATDYTAFLDAAALDGARLGVWRGGSATADAATLARARRRLWRGCAARARRSSTRWSSPASTKMGDPEFAALTHRVQA